LSRINRAGKNNRPDKELSGNFYLDLTKSAHEIFKVSDRAVIQQKTRCFWMSSTGHANDPHCHHSQQLRSSLPSNPSSVRQVTTVYCIIPGGKGDQAVGRRRNYERLITRESQNVGLIGFLSAFQILMSLSHCWCCPVVAGTGHDGCSGSIDLNPQQLPILSRWI